MMNFVKNSKVYKAIMIVIMITLLVGCSSSGKNVKTSSKDLPKVKIRISACNSLDHPQTIGLNLFKEIVEEESNGKITVNIYPNSQLGAERESVEQVKNGTLEMATASAGPLTTFDKNFMVLDIPFAFTNYEEAWMVLDSKAGHELFASLEEVGLKGLAFMENGFRHVTNSVRPIYKPEDLKGVKIRTMEAPMHMANFEALGANPTPVPWSELYMSMSQKIVDGQENPLANIWELNMYEVQKYTSLTGHIYDPMPLVTNLDWFNKLPESYQTIIQKAAILAQNYSRFVNKNRESKLGEYLVAKGMEVNELTDAQKEEFKKASQGAVIEKIKKEIDGAFVDSWIKSIEQAKSDVMRGME